MNVALTEAEKHLSDLVRRAQNGEEIVLTQAGKPDVKLTLADEETPNQKEMRAGIERVLEKARARPYKGESAARSQDFLYGWDGLPR